MLEAIKSMFRNDSEDTQTHDDPMVHIEYPQPFQQIVDGYDRDTTCDLKRTLETKRKDLKGRFELMLPDDYNYIRLRDKMGWMWKKIIYCDHRLSAIEREKKDKKAERREANIARAREEARLAEERKAEKERRRLAHEAMLKEHEARKSGLMAPAEKFKTNTQKNDKITHIAIWYNTKRGGETMEISNETEVIEWWLKKLENLEEADSDMVPMDLRPRSLTQAQFDRLPKWIKDNVHPTPPTGNPTDN